MSQKETIHIVPHSHWDREWYIPFEKHRFRLIKLMDALIEKMENDPEYKYYHLDGQMIVIEDYLKIKPYMYDRLKKLIDDGRIQVGPWYVLQDEFLVSDEANVRNMLMGFETAKDFGVKPLKIGYLPDSFGNISQMPQIFKKCGIDSVVFGRGVENKAEVIWESPDGSRVFGAHFTPWYNNAAELPTDSEAAKLRAEKMLNNFRAASKMNHYLGMNGSDHQPVQLDLPEALKAMNAATDEDVTFIHSNISDYMDELKKNENCYPVISEEMTGQNTAGFNLLISTASSRIYLKQKNHKAQNMLERIAEPMGAVNYLCGGEYQQDFYKYAWKRLMENHAHDSICGCSVDEVHSEMMTRFDNVIHTSEAIAEEAFKELQSKLKVKAHEELAAVVFNNSLYSRSDIVTAVIDVPEEKGMAQLCLTDENGNIVCESATVYPHTFTYTLPDDAFRKVQYVNRYVFRFMAENVPAFGYSVFYAKARNENADSEAVMCHTSRSAENDFVRLEIENDGSLTVTEKKSGKTFCGLNIYEDTADIGDEYIFRGNGTNLVTTKGTCANIKLKEACKDFVTFEICHELSLPQSYDRNQALYSENTVPFKITTEVTLTRSSRAVKVAVKMENESECHRLRALFCNDIKTDSVYANGQFDVVCREIQTRPNWKWDTNEQRLQSFVGLKDDQSALLVATRALYEYEVLRDGSNTLCLNLLRCVDQLGDWGVFPTPQAQCKGVNTAEYEIYVGEGSCFNEFAVSGLQFASGDMFVNQITDVANCNGSLETQMFSVSGGAVWNTAFKKADNQEKIVLRLYNLKDEQNDVVLNASDRFTAVCEADLTEKAIGESVKLSGDIKLTFAPKEIKTLIFE